MNLKLKATSAYQAIKFNRNPIFGLRKPIMVFCFLLALGLAAVGIYALTQSKEFIFDAIKHYIGGAVIAFCIAIIFWELDRFYNNKLIQPTVKYSLSQALKNPDKFNLAGFFDFELAKAFYKALKLCRKKKDNGKLKHALLYFILLGKSKEINFVFSRGDLNLVRLKELLSKELSEIGEPPRISFSQIITQAIKTSIGQKRKLIGVGDILISFAKLDPLFQDFLINSDFKEQDIINLVFWHRRLVDKKKSFQCWWSYNNLLKRGAIGKDWVSAYTVVLDRYSIDLRERIRKNGFRQIVGHKKEIEQAERTLEKEEMNNVLLVGEPGTGRGSIIQALAQKAYLGKSAPSLNYKRFLQIDLKAILAEAETPHIAEAILEQALKEAMKAGNIILVIDDFHDFVPSSMNKQVINVAGAIARYLSSSSFQVVAITTYQDFHNIIARNSSLANLFDKVEVSEISASETMVLLENSVPFFEFKHKRFIGYRALREILRLSNRYLSQMPFPEKATRLLDESMSYLALYTKDKVLLEKHIKKVVSEKTDIPLEDLEEKEKKLLLNLEDKIHQRLINQNRAVKDVSDALRRARAEVNLRKGPIGSFLFLGSTGVGKTELAKTLAEIYFGDENKMIRFDMSEFQTTADIKRLIGSQEQEGLLTTAAKENPFSLLLLDEIEKAHPNILTLFLQVLDEGWLTDNFGRKVDFRNTIIISTSNAAGEFIRQIIGAGQMFDKEQLLDYILKQGMFRPEFINRFDAIVAFEPLSKENLIKIAHLMLNKLSKGLLDKGVKFEITKELKEKIVEMSYNPEFGAREMKRTIQDNIENVMARGLLSGALKRGNSVKIDPQSFRLIINPPTMDN